MSLTPFERSLFWDFPIHPTSSSLSFPKKFDVSVDMQETDNDFVLTAELPGVDKSKIDVSISNNILSISAERVETKEEKTTKTHLSERFYGSLRRSLSIPRNINVDNISAKYTDGVLRIVMPKEERTNTKSLKIE